MQPDEENICVISQDSVAGHVRLELRNVVAKYPFERSR